MFAWEYFGKFIRDKLKKKFNKSIRKRKIKVKAVCGSYSTVALRHIVLLPEWVPSFISRGAAHTKQLEGPLLGKEGTIPGIYLAIRNSRKLLGSLTCRKAGTWDRFFYFPSGGSHVEDFYVRKTQRLRPGLNPQVWVPEASMLTTRPPKPSSEKGKSAFISFPFVRQTSEKVRDKNLNQNFTFKSVPAFGNLFEI